MPKYYDAISDSTNITQKTGSALIVSSEFRVGSSTILSQCNFMQKLLQGIIFTSHGAELLAAKKTLREFSSPKARFEFLSTFPYQHDDPIVMKVFEFSRQIFGEIYELRNIIAHEVWASSDEYPDYILFSTQEENARLLMISSRVLHTEAATPQEMFDANIRYIQKIKLVSPDHLKFAIQNADLCSWCMMQIDIILTQTDLSRRKDARQAFLTFGGTSHLFSNTAVLSGSVEFTSERAKTINGVG